MSEIFPAYDGESDRLVATLVDSAATQVDKRRASEQLYRRHSGWVVHRISKEVYNPEDIQDIAQVVWMMVLDIKVLEREYVEPAGKFRAYLRNPIRWAIGKHMEKLPYMLDDDGEKHLAAFTPYEDSHPQGAGMLSGHRIYQMIETVIKPNIKSLTLKIRNVYLLNEHDVLFDTSPSVTEIARINDITREAATELLNSSSPKTPAECSDEEFSVHVPVNYESLIDRAQLDRNSTAYLSGFMGVTQAAYRKRLYTGRRQLIEAARDKMLGNEIDEGTHHG